MKLRIDTNAAECVCARLSKATAAFVLFGCLLLAGCAANGGAKSSAKKNAPTTVLADSLAPLRQQFNADKDKLRVLALLSPT